MTFNNSNFFKTKKNRSYRTLENTNISYIYIRTKLIFFEVIQSACKQYAFQNQALRNANLTLIKII